VTTDEQSIRDIINRFEASWNAGDSEAFAQEFAPDADFIHIFGGQLEGRAAIEAGHRQIFQTVYKGSHVKFTLLKIRLAQPEVAIVFLQAHLDFFEGGAQRQLDTRPTFVAVKENSRWTVVAFQNTRISDMPPVPK
jgi:uncharacterized protein (TIGR02246 family)